MVVRSHEGYAHWREPPFTEDEESFLNARIVRDPTAIHKGTEAARLPFFVRSERYLSAHDQLTLTLGECIRGYVDAQDASNWTYIFSPVTLADAESVFVPMTRPLGLSEAKGVIELGKQFSLADVFDCGVGFTLTTMCGAPLARELHEAVRAGLIQSALRTLLPDSGDLFLIHVESGYHDFRRLWSRPEGSGHATRYLLDWATRAGPSIRDAFDRNPYIPPNALARLARDTEWTSKWGPARGDIQHARSIIGTGPGWLNRLAVSLERGEFLP